MSKQLTWQGMGAVTRWLGLGVLVACAACATPGPVKPGATGGDNAAADDKALERERTTLQQQAKTRPPAQLTAQFRRDLGWAELLGGDNAAAQTQLELAGAGDVRALFGLALLAQEFGQTRAAQGRWLALLEQVAQGKAAGQSWAGPLAEVAAHRLLTLGSDGGGPAAEAKLRQRLQALWQNASGLPLESRQLIAALLGQLQRLAGDEAGAQKVDTERGCPPEFFVSGPLGHLPVLDLQTPLLPDDPARDPQRAAYQRKTGSGCSLALEGVPGQPGVMYATTWLQTDRPASWPVTVESGNAPWALYVDGQQAFLDPEPIRRRHLWLQLPAGWHSVAIKIGVGTSHAQVQLAIPGVRFFTGRAAAAPPVQSGAVTVKPRALTAPPPPHAVWERALGRLVVAQQSYLLGDAETGLTTLAPLLTAAPRCGSVALVQAGLILDDRGRPERLGRDQARALLDQTLTYHPELVRVRLSLATMLLQDEKAEQALELLDARPVLEPTWQQALLRFRVLKARSWTYEADRALTAARTLGPSVCPLLSKWQTGAGSSKTCAVRCRPPRSWPPATPTATATPMACTTPASWPKRGASTSACWGWSPTTPTGCAASPRC